MPVTSATPSSALRRWTRIAAVLVWCAAIFTASARPNLRIADDETLDFVLRKSAHAIVFAVLALLITHAIADVRTRNVSTRVWAWVLTIAFACTDEWHQTFVRGREGRPRDVAIDAAGAAVALFVSALLVRRSTRPGDSTA